MPWLSWKCSLFSPPLTKDSRKDGRKHWLGQEVTSAGGTARTHSLDPSVFPVWGVPSWSFPSFSRLDELHLPNHLFQCLGLREKICTLLLHHFRSLFSPWDWFPLEKPCTGSREGKGQTQSEVPTNPNISQMSCCGRGWCKNKNPCPGIPWESQQLLTACKQIT